MRKRRHYRPSSKQGFKIAEEKKEKVREVFIRQLRSMGMSPEEIKIELEKLIQ